MIVDFLRVKSSALDFLLDQRVSDCQLLITGGTGFLGSWILKVLESAEQILGIVIPRDILVSPFSPIREIPESVGHVKYFVRDLRENLQLTKQYSHIVHMATPRNYEMNSQYDAISKTATKGLKQIINISAKFSTPPRLALMSSGAVYGRRDLNSTPILEDEWMGTPSGTSEDNFPITTYGLVKREQEILLNAASSLGIVRGISVRAFTFYGAGLPLDTNFAIGNFLRDASRREAIKVRSLGKSMRSYQHARDFAIDFLHVIFSDYLGPINLGSSDVTSIRKLAEVIADLFGTQIQHNITKDLDDANYYVPDLTALRHLTGPREQIDFHSGLLDWYGRITSEGIDASQQTHI